MEKNQNEKMLVSLTVGELKKLISDEIALSTFQRVPKPEVSMRAKRPMTIREASKHLNLSVPTLYSMNCLKKIPFTKVTGKVYYSEDALDKWLKSGERKTTAQLRREACDNGIRKN